MLLLPPGLEVDRDLEEERRLMAQVREYLEQEDRVPGIHVSDLLDPRLAFWKTKTGDPIPDRLLNMFMVGKVAHGLIELIGGADHGKHDVGGKYEAGIWYSPDEFHPDGTPVEIKTTRSFYLPDPRNGYLPNDDTFHMYFEQLLAYMALEGVIEGRLKILFLNSKGEDGRTEPKFFVWTLKTTPENLALYKAQLERARDQLANALESGDHTVLPLCRAWKCENCEYFEACKPEGRWGVPKAEWLKPRKTKDSKKSK
jgi:hypothetical protein